jgi:hypothetical protein
MSITEVSALRKRESQYNIFMRLSGMADEQEFRTPRDGFEMCNRVFDRLIVC